MKSLKLLALSLLLLAVFPVQAYSFKLGRLCYNVNSDQTTVSVTYEYPMSSSENNYQGLSGLLVIPPDVTYNNVTYTVTSIGDDAFHSCIHLKSVQLPNTIVSIGKKSFTNCTMLKDINIPNSVITIGDFAFYKCSAVDTLSIGNSVSTLGYGAFSNCTGLKHITIPNSVTSIGKDAFVACESLTNITIPNSVTKLESGTFNWCTSLVDVALPNSIQSVENYAFSHCGIVGIELPNSVKTIGANAFAYCQNLRSIVIPNSVTKIGDRAFCECPALTDVVFGTSVTSLGSYLFDNSTGLKNITWNAVNCTLPTSDVGQYIQLPFFWSRDSIKSFNFGDQVESIPSLLCYQLSALTNIHIPKSVKSIGKQAFRKCSALTTISVDPENTVYDSRGDCNAIIQKSNNTLILGCQSTIIPDNVTSLGASAFRECSTLTEIKIPNSVTYIGGSVFQSCQNLKRVTVGNSLKTIDTNAFNGCTSLDSINLPATLQAIGAWAFISCKSLKSIEIPPFVKSIGAAAFESNTALKAIYCKPTTIPTIASSSTFSGVDKSNCMLYVPVGCYDTYSQAEYWKEFKNIRESTFSVVKSTDVNSDGKTDIADLNLSVSVLLDLVSLTPEQRTICDCNKDGQIDIADINLIISEMVGK